MLLLNIVGETQTKARTSRKSECLLGQGAKHNKPTIWTQSKECASKDNAKIWKAYELQSKVEQGVDVLWLMHDKWRVHRQVLVVQRMDNAIDWTNHYPPTKPQTMLSTGWWLIGRIVSSTLWTTGAMNWINVRYCIFADYCKLYSFNQ